MAGSNAHAEVASADTNLRSSSRLGSVINFMQGMQAPIMEWHSCYMRAVGELQKQNAGAAANEQPMKTFMLLLLPLVMAARNLGYKWANQSSLCGAPPAATTAFASVVLLPVLGGGIYKGFGRSELMALFSNDYLWFICPGFCNALGKFMVLLGLQRVSPTLAVVMMRCQILFSIPMNAVMMGKRPDVLTIMGAVLVFLLAVGYTFHQMGTDPGSCFFTLSISTGDEETVHVGAHGSKRDFFHIGECCQTFGNAAECIQNGFPNGVNLIKNQDNATAGYAGCCGQTVEILSKGDCMEQTSSGDPDSQVNISGVLFVLTGVFFDTLGDFLIQGLATRILHKVSHCDGNANAARLRALIANEFWKLLPMVLIACVFDVSLVLQQGVSVCLNWTFWVGAVLPLALAIAWANGCVILCGAFWVAVATAAQLVLIYLAEVLLFGNKEIDRVDLMILGALLAAVLKTNLMAQKVEETASSSRSQAFRDLDEHLIHQLRESARHHAPRDSAVPLLTAQGAGTPDSHKVTEIELSSYNKDESTSDAQNLESSS